MADLRYTIHGHISHPDGSEKVVEDDDRRYVDGYELNQEADIAAHILDQPTYDGDPVDDTGLPPVVLKPNDPYSMAYLVNMDLPSPLGLKDIDNMSRHLHPQHNKAFTDYGKVSIASIAGLPDSMGSDKVNISSLVNVDDVGIDMSPSSEEIGSVMVNAPLGSSTNMMNSNETHTINGVVYNSRGYEVCGQLNQHSKPCQRIGRCPFHGGKKPEGGVGQPQTSSPTDIQQMTTQSPPQQSLQLPPPQPQPQLQPQPALPPPPQPHQASHQTPHVHLPQVVPPPPPLNQSAELDRSPILQPAAPIKKAPYKQGWTKDEHVRFLNGLQIHGKGAWKEIAQIVGSRTPTQIQSHAQKYYLRQKQEVKNKRSIHDLSLEDLTDADNVMGMSSRPPIQHNPNFNSLANQPSPQNSQEAAPNPLGLLFSSFYRAPGGGSTNSTTAENNASSSSSVPPLAGQAYNHTSTFRTQPPPPMAQPAFSNSSLHSNTLLPHLNSSHHNSLPPLNAPNTSISHAPAAPFPTALYSNWFSSTFSAPAGSKMLSLPEFGIDDDVSVGDGLGMDDLHQTSSSNSVRNLISINDDDHPPLTHHLPHPPYPHDDDDKLNQFSSSYMSIPSIPRIDDDSNELPPLTGSRKRHFIDDDKDSGPLREKFKGSPPHQQVLPLYLNHSP